MCVLDQSVAGDQQCLSPRGKFVFEPLGLAPSFHNAETGLLSLLYTMAKNDDSGLPLYSDLTEPFEAAGASQADEGLLQPLPEPPQIQRSRSQTLVIAGFNIFSLMLIVWLAHTSSSLAQVAILDMRSADLNLMFKPVLDRSGVTQEIFLKDTGLYEKYSVYTWGMCGQNEGGDRRCHHLDDAFRLFPREVFALDSPELLNGNVQVHGPRDLETSLTDKQMIALNSLVGDTERGLTILGIFALFLSIMTLKGAYFLGTHPKGQADILLLMVGFLAVLNVFATLVVALATDDELGTTISLLFNRSTDPLGILAHTPTGRQDVLLVILVLACTSAFYSFSVAFSGVTLDGKPSQTQQIPLQDLSHGDTEAATENTEIPV